MYLLKKTYKYIIGIVLICLFILVLLGINKHNENNKSNDCGYITVFVNNINDEIVSKKRIKYEENDRIVDLIKENYDLIYEDSVYGTYILGFNELNIKTDGLTSWIWIELGYIKDGATYQENINFDDYDTLDSTVGIDQIELKDNMIIGFNQRDGNTTTSIFDNEIKAQKDDDVNLNLIFGIILVIMMCIVIIVLIIVNIKSDKMTVKEMCILSFMAVILFVQEEILSFIPNFQFTFLLIALYSSIFGIKKSSMIVLIHVILDNLFMGSLNVVVVLPMIIGYELTIILINIVKNKKLIYIILMIVVSSIVYCMSFLVVNALMLDINVYHYFIADIPFELLLIISNIFTVLWFYRPLENCIKNNYYKIIEKNN